MRGLDERAKLLPKFLKAGSLLVLTAALLLPIWCVRQAPLLDYPNHLARTFVLSHLHDPAYHFGADFRSDWGPYPYVSMDLALLALQHVTSPEIAGKLVLSLAVLLLPLCTWWFLRQVNRGHEMLALFACLICYDVFFIEGFINFQLGLAISLLAAGCWQRDHDAPSPGNWLITFCAVMLAYFTHLIAFGFVGILLMFAAVIDPGELRRLRSVLRTLALFLPGGILFLLMRPGLKERHELEFRALLDKLQTFYMVPVHGFSDRADNACLVLLAICVPLAVVKNRELRWNGRWAWVWLALAAIYFAAPVSWGQSYDVDSRVLPLLFLLCFCVVRIGRRVRVLALVAVVVAVIRITDVTSAFRGSAPLMDSLAASIACIEPNSRVFPIVEGRDDDPIERPFAHYWAYATIRRGAFTPYLFDIPGQTPLRITSDAYAPDGFWDLTYTEDPDWQQVRDGYDYVWAYRAGRFASVLERIAVPVYRSGELVLYRIRREDRKQPLAPPVQAHLSGSAAAH